MNKLINTKWLGALVLFVFILGFSTIASTRIKEALTEYGPKFLAEASEFLPITIENGQIVSPKDTVITRKYLGAITVKLDTTTDELNTSDLGNGVYITRRNFYTVTPQKIQIQSLSTFPNAIIDDSALEAIDNYVKNNSGWVLFAFIFIFYGAWSMAAILLYTVVMHWIVTLKYKVPFSRTLRVNTLVYVILSLFSALLWAPSGAIIRFILLLAVNFGVNAYLSKTEINDTIVTKSSQ